MPSPSTPLGTPSSLVVADAHSIGSGSRTGRTPIEYWRLLAETLEYELEQERQRCLATGERMPPEWTASLEKERREIMDRIRRSESPDSSTTPLPEGRPSSINSALATRAPGLRPPPLTSVSTTTQERGRSSSPYPFPSELHPATAAVSDHPTDNVNVELEGAGRSLGIRKRERQSRNDGGERDQDDEQRIHSRFKSPRSSSPSVSLSHPRHFLLPAPVQDVKTITVGGLLENPHLGNIAPLPPSRPSTSIPWSTKARDSSSAASIYDVRAPVSGESGRRSARGWYPSTPRPDQSLRRLAHSHALTDSPKSLIGKLAGADDDSYWSVIAEDEDDTPTSVYSKTDPERTPTVANTTLANMVGLPGVSQSSTPPPRTHGHTVQTVPQTVPPSILNHRHPVHRNLDERIRPSSAAAGVSGVYKTKEAGVPGGSIGIQIANICQNLMVVFRDISKYKKFLSYRDEAAQSLLNFLQTLLDYSQLEERFRCILFVALLRLSRKSDLYPDCFALTDVTREGEHPIADGHFGEIYKGYFRNRSVGLKVVKMYEKSDLGRLYKAFSREAVLWGQLSHVNVLPFYGIYRLGDTRNRIGLVSPWMEHGNVNEFLRQNPGVDRRLLVSDIAAGILYLHNNNVIHGDLKGSNILVTPSGRACLADFGLSSVTDSQGLKSNSLSSANQEGGTVRFQAPELIDPQKEGPRSQASDVYAFAFVCYEIFTGWHPFPEVAQDFTVMLKVTRGERPSRPVGSLYWRRGLTDVMWLFMEACWKHDPAHRPTAAQIVGRLPRGLSVDTRPKGGWGDLSPSRFRASDGYGHPDRHDLSVVETLRVLETIGVSLFKF